MGKFPIDSAQIVALFMESVTYGKSNIFSMAITYV